jgi:hypothetical protein
MQKYVKKRWQLQASFPPEAAQRYLVNDSPVPELGIECEPIGDRNRVKTDFIEYSKSGQKYGMDHSKQTDPRSKFVLLFCIDRATTLSVFSVDEHDFELPPLRKRSSDEQNFPPSIRDCSSGQGCPPVWRRYSHFKLTGL